jgi:3-hydroxyisobutyrate dehydrogenase-like beta-hydroxyacid dehydrogenase
VKPSTVVELATEAEGRGLALIDAPVTGGEKAERGLLSVMVGGDQAAA